MNIIFLDIDGVLNNLGSVAAFGNPSKYLDPVSIGLIAKLCEQAPAQIVISSSWRNGDTAKIENDLRTLGCGSFTARIIDETDDLLGVRGEEIAKWWKENGHMWDGYVIIDDDSDMLPGQPFVKTTFQDGFRFEHYVKCMRILNPEHRDADRRLIS